VGERVDKRAAVFPISLIHQNPEGMPGLFEDFFFKFFFTTPFPSKILV
jgi:hypothetical protein